MHSPLQFRNWIYFFHVLNRAGRLDWWAACCSQVYVPKTVKQNALPCQKSKIVSKIKFNKFNVIFFVSVLKVTNELKYFHCFISNTYSIYIIRVIAFSIKSKCLRVLFYIIEYVKHSNTKFSEYSTRYKCTFDAFLPQN